MVVFTTATVSGEGKMGPEATATTPKRRTPIVPLKPLPKCNVDAPAAQAPAPAAQAPTQTPAVGGDRMSRGLECDDIETAAGDGCILEGSEDEDPRWRLCGPGSEGAGRASSRRWADACVHCESSS